MNELEKMLAEAHGTNFRNTNNVKELIASVLQHGFTRTNIASFCEVSRLTVCAWEVGEMVPNNKHAAKLREMYAGLFGEMRV
jgi:DNA-binding XRE family transcriptional regulator